MRRYVALISGGPDSMALLDMLSSEIAGVCHFNYGMRSSSRRDENIVRDYCEKKKIAFFCKREKITAWQGNFQSWAREARYELLRSVAASLGIKVGITAHQRDDDAETALMQLKRGSKSPFYGINCLSEWKSLKIIRPLLGIRKRNLEAYCTSRKICYGLDETNSDPRKAERNKIRKEISQWSDVRFESFMQFVKTHNKEHRASKLYAEDFYLIWKSKPEIIPLLALPRAAQRHTIYLLLKERSIRYAQSLYNALIEFLRANAKIPNKRMRIGGGYFAATIRLSSFLIGRGLQEEALKLDRDPCVVVVVRGDVARD